MGGRSRGFLSQLEHMWNFLSDGEDEEDGLYWALYVFEPERTVGMVLVEVHHAHFVRWVVVVDERKK